MTDLPPYIDPLLVEWLRNNFPKRSYTPAEDVTQIMYAEGQQNLIDILARLVEDQANGK